VAGCDRLATVEVLYRNDRRLALCAEHVGFVLKAEPDLIRTIQPILGDEQVEHRTAYRVRAEIGKVGKSSRTVADDPERALMACAVHLANAFREDGRRTIGTGPREALKSLIDHGAVITIWADPAGGENGGDAGTNQ
jgi:hypothetical protein